ncbi:hypothetical protein MC885_018214 [Smutsia gigantea]|nr:hypothetical protein MC885_018214 [Smutsia gigantea]
MSEAQAASRSTRCSRVELQIKFFGTLNFFFKAPAAFAAASGESRRVPAPSLPVPPPQAGAAVRGRVSPPRAGRARCGRLACLACLRVPRGTVVVMLTLASKLKRDDGLRGSRAPATASDSTRRVSVRDRLLVKGGGSVLRAVRSCTEGLLLCQEASRACKANHLFLCSVLLCIDSKRLQNLKLIYLVHVKCIFLTQTSFIAFS